MSGSSTKHLDQLLTKLNHKTATIGVFGLGYVGLPLCLRFSAEGYAVVGFDIDLNKVGMLNKGRSYIEHIGNARVEAAVKNGFRATTHFSEAKKCDALIICVPTPLNRYREPDLSFVTKTMDSIAPYLRPGHIVSLESTTYPGTTDEEIVPRVEARGFKIGTDVFVVHSPEREDPGNPSFNTKTIPKICGGITPSCLKAGLTLYGGVIDKVIPVSTAKTAELTKLLENIHRAVNIGLVNEMKIVADKMGIDIFEVIRAASTKPFGFTAYYPGPGIGGHCIPIDPFYLTWKAREFGVNTRFIELAGEVNHGMSQWVVDKIIHGLNLQRKSLKGSKVLVLGIAYKKNVDDMRESPSVAIMELLKKDGAVLSYSDPHVPVFPRMREHYFPLKSTPLSPKTISKFDCVLIGTNHDKFDYAMIKKSAKLIVDTRGVYQQPAPNVVKA